MSIWYLETNVIIRIFYDWFNLFTLNVNRIMLKFNFPRVFKARGIDRPSRFLVSHGYSTNMATRMVNDRTRQLNVKDVEKLCLILNCTPNDFFDWIPEKNDINMENHPLNALKRSDKVILAQLINDIPMDRLADIEKLVKKELEK